MKSLSEIETVSKRASRAAGFSWGVSEEVGKNIRLLELFGFQGIKNLNQYYQSKMQKNFENIKLINQSNKPKEFLFCPITLGVSFLDQIKSIEVLKKCSFKELAYPILLLPFLSQSSEISGKKILFVFDKFEFLLNFNINIYCNTFKKNFPTETRKVDISFLDNKDSFSDQDWNALYKLSEDTFVEESDISKKETAGAGLTDND